jgi:hypothetical protein
MSLSLPRKTASRGTLYKIAPNIDPETGQDMKGSSGQYRLKEKSSERKGQFCSLVPVLRLSVGYIS